MIRSILGVLLIGTFGVGCKTQDAVPTASETEAFVSKIDGLVPIPTPKSSMVLDQLSRNIVESGAYTFKQSPHLVGLPSAARGIFLKQVQEVGGLPRYQGKKLLSDLLDDSKGHCGGARCSQVFGIQREQIDGFLDETHQKLLVSKELGKSEHSSARRILLGSLQKAEDPSVNAAARKPLEVVYKAVQDSYEKGVKVESKVGHFAFEIKPNDLTKAKSLECDEDICKLALTKPISVNVDVPVTMNANVSVAYKRTMEADGITVSHAATVGAHATPVKLGKVVSVGVDFSADLEKNAATSGKLVVKKVDCSGAIKCDLPLIKLGATIDKTGIEFDAHIKVDSFGNDLIKVTGQPPVAKYKVNFSDLPANIQKIKEGINKIDAAGKRIVRPDIDWNSFANSPFVD